MELCSVSNLKLRRVLTKYCYRTRLGGFHVWQLALLLPAAQQYRWLLCFCAVLSKQVSRLALLKWKCSTVFSTHVRNTDNPFIIRFIVNILGHIVRYCHSIKKMWILIFNLYTTTGKNRNSILFKIFSSWNIFNLKLNGKTPNIT